MNVKINTTLTISICLFLMFFSQFISGQEFKKIEKLAKLDFVKNNHGVAVADYDLDNDLDIFIVGREKFDVNRPETWSRLFRNNNDGSFTDVTAEAGFAIGFNHSIPVLGGRYDGDKMGVSWGDYDNDGYPDIFLANANQSQLYHNNGDGTFSNVTESAGFDVSCDSCYLMGATWGDVNNDGYLDIYLSDNNFTSKNKFYLNNKDGTFTKVDGVDTASANSYSSLIYDFNNDSSLDIYVTNDFKDDNYLYLNNNSIYTESAVDLNLQDPKDGMGVGVCDFNNDGFFDLLVTNINENSFFTNDGNYNYTDEAAKYGIFDTGWAWGFTFSDFDLDGFEDLYITNGLTNPEKNVYFKNIDNPLNTGSRIFSNASELLEENNKTTSKSAVSFDYDNDGDLDLIITNTSGNLVFYENKLNVNDKNWVKIKLEGSTSNRDGLNSVIEVTTANLKLHRMHSGTGFQSQSIQPEHFGLSNAAKIIEIKVKWPSGNVQVVNNIDVNSTILIKENNGYSIIDNNTSAKVKGCTDVNSCNYNPNATEDDGSCEYVDAGNIIGAFVSEVLKTEQYSYDVNGVLYNWSIVNGEIISGQGTANVSVKWHLANKGEISVVMNNGTCSTEPVVLNVSLNGRFNNSISSDGFSVARIWNEALLEAIRKDFARPTVHARNLFHTSIAMYDCWAIFNENSTYLIGNSIGDFTSNFTSFIPNEEKDIAINKALSYASYRLLKHRFANSPNAEITLNLLNDLMTSFNYDTSLTSADYSSGDASALGNYIAEEIINFGFQDGSNELGGYGNKYYESVNTSLIPIKSGVGSISDPNRWQPLSLDVFVDQSGNVIEKNATDFLSPEWGDVTPFSLTEDDKSTYNRDGNSYNVYSDPGSPPYIGDSNVISNEQYKWGFSLVSIWGAHLTPYDGVMWDISPKANGNISLESLPKSLEEHPEFYKQIDGGDVSKGRSINPITNKGYESQFVPRGDYTRVLAEFWADGPDSETPPGHWFALLNYVSDHPLLEKKMNGKGRVLSNLEWDVKTYFGLGGAMHDAAIAAWSIKGWYDYIRPISAIRYMADNGQSTDASAANYNINGMPLVDGYIEVVNLGDPLAGINNEHIGKIKVYTWRGHKYINDTNTDVAGVDWILAENWWPYQRPSFVTPPFAGYVSGHSTFSRAAAEVLTLFTGSEYFPGGMGEFIAKKNDFLVFESGPSVDVTLQWATYRDASDQCSLSRIWGGIHPPADDIPGRLIGEVIGKKAYYLSVNLFNNNDESISELYPNPTDSTNEINITNTSLVDEFLIVDIVGRVFSPEKVEFNKLSKITKLTVNLSTGFYLIKSGKKSWKLLVK